MVGLALAIPTTLITIIRLGVRTRAQNLGLDDAFAASSLVGFLVYYVAFYLHSDSHRTPLPFLVFLSHLDCLYLSASSRPLFRHNEVHDLLHLVPRLWLGRMVSRLDIPYMFSPPHAHAQVRPPFYPFHSHPNYSSLYENAARLAFRGLELRRSVDFSSRTGDVGL